MCDCKISWLPPWLQDKRLTTRVQATCTVPKSLKGQSIFNIQTDQFVCDRKYITCIYCMYCIVLIEGGKQICVLDDVTKTIWSSFSSMCLVLGNALERLIAPKRVRTPFKIIALGRPAQRNQ